MSKIKPPAHRRKTPTSVSPAVSTPRAAILTALADMPEEAFGWLAVALAQRIWPDGLGGFMPASRASIDVVKAAATTYMETPHE